MDRLIDAFDQRAAHIGLSPPGVFELRAMLTGRPDLVLWRRSAGEIQQQRRIVSQFDHLAGFLITREPAALEIHDRHGSLIANRPRTASNAVASGPCPDWRNADAVASLILKAPYRLAESFPCVGAPVNLEANHSAIIRELLSIKRAEHHLVGVSFASTGGGAAVYLDPQTAPAMAQDLFLDRIRDLTNGDVIDWRAYDTELLRAVGSYRFADFCGWVADSLGGAVTKDDVAARISAAPDDQHRLIYHDTLSVLVHHLIYHTDDEKGKPETLDFSSDIVLPQRLLALFS